MRVLSVERDESASIQLDALRALAAIAVAIGHVRASFLLDAQSAGALSLPEKAFYFATGLGHQAVIIFFVLSGLFVGGGVVAKLRDGRFDLGRYVVARASRLYPALIVCLLVGWALDAGGIALFGEVGSYAASPGAAISPERVADRLGVVTLLGNLAFLQTIAVDTFGSNGPLWSLANEWWYYLAFPLLAGLGAASRGWARRGIGAALGVGILWMVGPQIAALFGVWLLGVALAFVVPPRRFQGATRALLIGGALAIFLVALVATRTGALGHGLLADYVLGVATAALVWALVVCSREASRTSLGARVWPPLAAFSFTLYILHMPVVAFVRAWLQPEGQSASSPGVIGLLLLFLVALLGLSWAIAQVTEARTDAYRAWLMSALARVRPKRAAR